MNKEQSIISAEVAAEPTASRFPMPIWLIVFAMLLLYWSMVYFDQHSGWFEPQVYAPFQSTAEVALYQPPAPGGCDLRRGKDTYEKVCALCHQPDGMGRPGQFPPLAGSEWALGSPNRMIRIPLIGISGALKVKDQQWALAMPAMGAALSNEDLAAALCYIRHSWGNNASEITPEQVAAIRTEVGNRSQPLSQDELLKIPEK